jgi:hypothetical protein
VWNSGALPFYMKKSVNAKEELWKKSNISS